MTDPGPIPTGAGLRPATRVPCHGSLWPIASTEEWPVFEGFELSTIDTGEARIRVRHGGSGPPVLLLHGHPQTHVMWHKVGPRLARDFTVVAPDLRGYGDSTGPPTTPDYEPYSKRAIARDHVAVMRQLGFERF